MLKRDIYFIKDRPASLLSPSLLSPPSSLIPFLLSPLPPFSLPHSLSGRAMPEGPIQRVVAAAEASSVSSFHSESGFCFWGQGMDRAVH